MYCWNNGLQNTTPNIESHDIQNPTPNKELNDTVNNSSNTESNNLNENTNTFTDDIINVSVHDCTAQNNFERTVGGGPSDINTRSNNEQDRMSIHLDDCITWISSEDDSENEETDENMDISDNEDNIEDGIEYNSERQISNFIWFHPDWFLYSSELLNKLFAAFNLNESVLPKLQELSSNRITIFSQIITQEKQFEYHFLITKQTSVKLILVGTHFITLM